MHTDEEGVFNGFKARYMFEENSLINKGELWLCVFTLIQDWFYFLTSIRYMNNLCTTGLNLECRGGNHSLPGAPSGVLTSPKWPEKYDRSSGLLSCSWEVQSRPDHRIFLHFQDFSVEGELESNFFCFSNSIINITDLLY